jgi:hypothetical protein
MIETEFHGKVRQVAITSDNSRDPINTEFLKHIQERFLQIDVLIASPSLGTGIDISFPESASKVDCVYGFFVAMVNTHTDIDQQLARVRNPGSVRVWISPQRSQYETNFDVIRDDIARASIVRSAITGYDDDGRLQYDKDHPLLTISAHMICATRTSRNNLLRLFCALRMAQGWQIERIRKPDTKTAKGNRRLRRAKAAVEMNRVQALMNARHLSNSEFDEINYNIRRGNHVPQEQRIEHEKAYLERSLGVKLSPEIIELNRNNKLLETVKVFSSLQSENNESFFGQLVTELTEQGASKRWGKTKIKTFLAFVTFISGLLKNGDVDRNAIVSQRTLERFVTFCQLNQTIIEEIVGGELRQDLDVRAVMQLNRFLALAGLKLVSHTRKTTDGVQTHEYKLDPRRLALMSVLAEHYRLFKSSITEGFRLDRPPSSKLNKGRSWLSVGR